MIFVAISIDQFSSGNISRGANAIYPSKMAGTLGHKNRESKEEIANVKNVISNDGLFIKHIIFITKGTSSKGLEFYVSRKNEE